MKNHWYRQYECFCTAAVLRRLIFMEEVLTTESLGRYYKNSKALDGLNMHIPKGAIYGFVGKNGAGKTTLIRVICGL